MIISKILAYISAIFLIMVGPLVVFTEFDINGYSVAPVTGDEMNPEIKKGDLVLVKRENGYSAGDIITFKKSKDDSSNTLMVLEKQELKGVVSYKVTGKTLKGAIIEESEDRIVDENQVIGEVARNIPFLGNIVYFAQDPIGFIVVICVPVMFMMWVEVIRPRLRAHGGY